MKGFCNRRYTPKIVHCTYAGGFIHRKNIIKNGFNSLNTYKPHQKLHDDLSITWYHAPNKSPSQSSVTERILGTIKKPLIKTLQSAILTKTELYTILTGIDACIDSQQLEKLSENANDESLSCMTPSHLIIGKTLRSIPSDIHQQIELPRKNLDLVRRWKLRGKLAKLFWNGLTKEYLSNLRQYYNNNQFTKNLKPCDYCLVLSEKTADVTDVFNERDGLVWTVEVKLPHEASDIDRKGHPLKQIKAIRRGIESIILLEASAKDTTR